MCSKSRKNFNYKINYNGGVDRINISWYNSFMLKIKYKINRNGMKAFLLLIPAYIIVFGSITYAEVYEEPEELSGALSDEREYEGPATDFEIESDRFEEDDPIKEDDSIAEENKEEQQLNDADGAGDSQDEIFNLEATAYTAFCDTGCIGITRTGVDVSGTTHHEGHRVVAVDPNVIPLGSIMEVHARGWSFTAIAEDTGGVIQGHKLDVLVSNTDKAWNFGRQDVQVRIVRWGR